MLCNAVFRRVKLLHIIGQRHSNPDVLPGAFNGKTDVVCQGECGIRAERIRQFISGDLHDAGRKSQHIFGQFCHQLLILLIRVIKRALDLSERQFPGKCAETDAFSHRDQFPSAAVPAEYHIVVDPAQCLHRFPPPCFPFLTKKKNLKANGTAPCASSTRSCLEE